MNEVPRFTCFVPMMESQVLKAINTFKAKFCKLGPILTTISKKIGPLVLGSFGIMKSGGFHGHEIQQILWNLADFMVMKSGGFHGGIHWISWP